MRRPFFFKIFYVFPKIGFSQPRPDYFHFSKYCGYLFLVSSITMSCGIPWPFSNSAMAASICFFCFKVKPFWDLRKSNNLSIMDESSNSKINFANSILDAEYS